MKLQVVNETTTAGLQEQDQEQKLPQSSTIPCIWGLFPGKLS